MAKQNLKPSSAFPFFTAGVTVLVLSKIVDDYGLSERLFFNKSVLSAFVFVGSVFFFHKAFLDFKADRWIWAISYFLSFFLCFTEILGLGLRLKETAGGVELSFYTAFSIAAGGLLWGIWLELFFFWLMGFAQKKKIMRQGDISLNNCFFLSWLVFFLGYLPCFLAFYPGIYCYDMIWQWAMYATGSYSTHHPLIHTALSGAVLELGKQVFGSYEGGLALHSILQLFIVTGSMAFAFRYLVKIKMPWKVLAAAGGFYVLFPFFPVLGISTTKDVVFGSLFLVVFVCVCEMVMEKAVYKGWKLGLFIAAAVLMGLFRNNAVHGLFVTSVFLLGGLLISLWRKRKSGFTARLLVIFVISMVGIQAMMGILERGFDAEKGSIAEMMSVPCQQLARTYVYRGEEIRTEEKELLTRYIPDENLMGYKYYVSDPIKAGLDVDYLDGHKGEFIRLWLRLGSQFPGEYVQALLYNTMGIWYTGGDSSCFVAFDMMEPFDEEHMVEHKSLFPAAERYYRWFQDENLERYLPVLSLVFYSSFYCFAIILCGGIFLGKKQYDLLILPGFLIGYVITLIFGPCITVRYVMGIMMCIPVIGAIAFYGGNE